MELGFDLGTTNVKAVVTDGDGRAVATGSAPVERFYTSDGGIEQDIEQIWTATCTAIRQALRAVNPAAIQATAIARPGSGGAHG